MKMLYLLRHAKAEPQDPMGSDQERALTDSGKAESVAIGKWLRGKELRLDGMIVSPAKRTETTANIVAELVGFHKLDIVYDDILYKNNVESLMELLRFLSDDIHAVMLVGHNPSLSFLASQLTSHPNIQLKTANIAAISLPITSWMEVDFYGNELLWEGAPPQKNDE